MDIMERGRTTALTNFWGGGGTRGYVFSGSDCREWMDGWLDGWLAEAVVVEQVSWKMPRRYLCT